MAKETQDSKVEGKSTKNTENIDRTIEPGDRAELIALYQNAAENIFYFKRRMFWLMSSFTAFSVAFWSLVHGQDAFLLDYVDLVFPYFLLISLWFIAMNTDCIWKVQHHRQKIDRCAGFDTTLCGEIKESNMRGFGDLFFYARTGVEREKAKENNTVAFQDFGDKIIGVSGAAHIWFFSMMTIYEVFPKTSYQGNYNIPFFCVMVVYTSLVFIVYSYKVYKDKL